MALACWMKRMNTSICEGFGPMRSGGATRFGAGPRRPFLYQRFPPIANQTVSLVDGGMRLR